ncbi:MAG: DUF4012 domain-containing protein [Patescibacteria group bacterium]|jgi:hypothetical protein
MKQTPNFLTCPSVPSLPPADGENFDIKQNSKNGNLDSVAQPRLQTPEPRTPNPEPRSKKRSWIKWIVILVLLAAAFFLLMPAIALGRAAMSAYEAKQALTVLQADLKAGNYAAAASQAKVAQTSVESVSGALKGVGFFRDVPFIGTQVRSLQDVAAVGSSTLDSVHDLLNVAAALSDAVESGTQAIGEVDVQVASNRGWNDLTKNEKRNLLGTLQDSLPKIRLARDKIDMALAMWNAVPQERMFPFVVSALRPLSENLPIIRRAMDQSVPLLETLIPLAGYPTSKQYLVVLQNSDEMRPAGGFIGSVASVTVDAGQLDDFRFYDVYNIDNPVSGVWKEIPPEPLSKNLGVSSWFMRDANWSPDFVESASRVLDFYVRENALQNKDENPDGVIALEPGFFKELLHLIGPIQIRGKTYDEHTFMDFLEYDVEIGFLQQGISLEDRKAIMGELGSELLKKVQAMPRSDWPKLLNLLTAALREKQVMVYSKDADLQASLDSRGWSGRAKATTCDFMWVADANLAALKTDGKMVKSVSYELDARDVQNPTAKVTLNYQNTVTKVDWRYTRYRSYTRVYVPDGSQLISSQGAMQGDLLQTGGKFVPGKVDVMKELGKTVYGAFWAIEPGKTGSLSFTYSLPPSVSDCLAQNNYQLDWPKQPGADSTEINVKVLMPSTIKSAEPSEPESKWGDAAYESQADLREDREFKVKY